MHEGPFALLRARHITDVKIIERSCFACNIQSRLILMSVELVTEVKRLKN